MWVDNGHRYYRARDLTALAEQLPSVFLEALTAALVIQDEFSRAEALTALAFHLSQMQTVELVPLWQVSLRELSLRTRPQFLRDITAIVPVIFALGGSEAIASLSSAIQQVARW